MIDSTLKVFFEGWINEIINYIEGFVVNIISYEKNIIDNELQRIFNNLYICCFDENKTRNILQNATENIITNIEEYYNIYIDEFNIFAKKLILDNMDEINYIINKYINEKYKELISIDNLSIEEDRVKFEYIDKYKELNKIAEDNGYIHERDNGGHGIFINNKTKKIVVIPQGRTIGRGLSLVIQRSILEGTKVLPKEKINSISSSDRRKILIMESLKKLKIGVERKELLKIIDEQPEIFTCNINTLNKVIELKEKQLLDDVKEYIKRDDYKTTIKKMLKFSKDYPESINILAMLGGVYEASNNSDKAKEYYIKYIERNGPDYDVYSALIRVLLFRKEYEEAEKYQMILNGKFFDKISVLEEIKEAIENKEFDSAKSLIKKFEEQDISIISADDFASFAQWYYNESNYKEAREYCYKSLKMFPDQETAKEILNFIENIN